MTRSSRVMILAERHNLRGDGGGNQDRPERHASGASRIGPV
jgi:hypothetical protein